MARHADAGVGDEVLQARQRRAALVEQPAVQLGGEVAGVALQHGAAEGLLAGEVVVEGALGHADLLEHRVDAGDQEALLGEQAHAGMQ
ncbi:hypothetical protein D3C81_1657860 [compost metagenome]